MNFFVCLLVVLFAVTLTSPVGKDVLLDELEEIIHKAKLEAVGERLKDDDGFEIKQEDGNQERDNDHLQTAGQKTIRLFSKFKILPLLHKRIQTPHNGGKYEPSQEDGNEKDGDQLNTADQKRKRLFSKLDILPFLYKRVQTAHNGMNQEDKTKEKNDGQHQLAGFKGKRIRKMFPPLQEGTRKDYIEKIGKERENERKERFRRQNSEDMARPKKKFFF